MKKNILFALLLIFALTSCVNKQTYTLTGSFATPDFDGKTIYLQTMDYDSLRFVSLDSLQVKNGQFTFKGIASTPATLYFVHFDDEHEPAQFIAEAGKIQLTIDSTFISHVNGTPINDAYQQFTDTIDKLFEEVQSIHVQLNDDLLAGKIDEEEFNRRGEVASNLFTNTIYEFIKSHLPGTFGEYLLMDYSYYLQPEQIIDLISKSSPKFQSLEEIQMMKERTIATEKTSVGKMFVDISGKTLDGQTVSLSDYVGKGDIVLVDFWASWCGPCIRSLPDLIKIHKKFKNKKFVIVGVSLDDDKSSWEKATASHQIPWIQFSNLKGWKDEAAVSYGINSIPATVLIDKDGVILKRNVDADLLDKLLEELLK